MMAATATMMAIKQTVKGHGISKRLAINVLMEHPSKECGTNTCVHNAPIVLIHTCHIHALHCTAVVWVLNIFQTTKRFDTIFVAVSSYSSSMLSLLIELNIHTDVLYCTLTQPTFGLCMAYQKSGMEWNGYVRVCFYCCRCLYFTYHK